MYHPTSAPLSIPSKRFKKASCFVFKVVTEVELDILRHYSSMPSLLVFRFCFKRHGNYHLRRQLLLNCNGIGTMSLFLLRIQNILELLVACTAVYTNMQILCVTCCTCNL